MALNNIISSLADAVNPSKYLEKVKAYGDFSRVDGSYFCNPEKIDGLERITYQDEVRQFSKSMEAYMQHEGKSVEELNKFVNSQNLELLDKSAKCLADNGVDPSSVAQFSEPAKQVLTYNMEKLYMVAPNLTNNADVPFTGDAVMALALGGGVMGAMYGISKLRGKFGSLFHDY